MSIPRLPDRLARLLGRQPAAAPAAEQPASSETHAIRDYLELEGFNPRIDNDGDICFDYEGATMLLLFDRRDAENIRLTTVIEVLPPKQATTTAVWAIAHEVTQSIRFVKIILLKSGHVLASVEMIAPWPSSVIPCLVRAASALLAAAAAYRKLRADPPAG
ncbi:MAG: hypothetical protein ACKO01_02390 [Erythrobacter sp.]